MKEPDLVHVCPLEDVPAGEGRAFDVEGYEIAIINTGGEVYAVENRCPHQGSPLDGAEIVAESLVCPEHGWVIDLTTGEVVDHEGYSVATFPVTLDDDQVYIQLA